MPTDVEPGSSTYLGAPREQSTWRALLVGALFFSGIGGWKVWERYEIYYYSHTDQEYHSQCPNETGEYFDCEQWPREGLKEKGPLRGLESFWSFVTDAG